MKMLGELVKVVVVGTAVLCIPALTLIAQEKETKEKTEVVAEAEFDAAAMVGEWVFESGNRAGVEVEKERLGPVSISEKAFTIPVPESESFVMEYTLDTTKNPVQVDIKITAGPAPEAEAKGIIAIEDGKIKLCYHPEGGDRPETFEATEDNGFNYFVIAKPAEEKEDD